MNFYKSSEKELGKVEKEIAGMLKNEPKDVYGMILPYIMRGGKRVRPILAVLCCRATGGKVEKVIRPAALIEVFHNFTLIHDDICDSSQFRRGKPTLHISYGLPIALNSGDALYTLLWEHIIGLGMEPKKLVELEKLYVKAFKRVAEGQGRELMWYKKGVFSISEKQYVSMIDGKTAALLGLSCELGAYIAGAGKTQRAALRNFGELIGKAFQIQDDVLNVTGDFKKYQKEIGGDITEGKRTLMLIKTMKKANANEKKNLVRILGSGKAGKKEIAYVIGLFRKYRAIGYAQKTADALVEKAKKQLRVLKKSSASEALFDLANYITSREA
jgi:geranylgeranyl diphosphate synthase type I